MHFLERVASVDLNYDTFLVTIKPNSLYTAQTCALLFNVVNHGQPRSRLCFWSMCRKEAIVMSATSSAWNQDAANSWTRHSARPDGPSTAQRALVLVPEQWNCNSAVFFARRVEARGQDVPRRWWLTADWSSSSWAWREPLQVKLHLVLLSSLKLGAWSGAMVPHLSQCKNEAQDFSSSNVKKYLKKVSPIRFFFFSLYKNSACWVKHFLSVNFFLFF